MKEANARFIEVRNNYNVFEFLCPGCGVEGEMGIPRHSQDIVKHECGTLYKQSLPRGIFGKPVLEIIWVVKKGGT